MGQRRSGLQRSFPAGDRAFVISRPRSKRRFLIPHRLAELTLPSSPETGRWPPIEGNFFSELLRNAENREKCFKFEAI